MKLRHPSAEQKSFQASRSGRRRWRSAALLAALVALGLGLAGYGGGSSNASSDPASAAISGCSPSGCSSPAASASAEAIAVKFSGCMRSHGVTEFPDPTIGSNGLPSFGPTRNVNGGARVYNAAHQACKHDLPNIGPHTAAERAAANRAALKYATCMRSNGVPDFPDPNGQGLIQINHATGALVSTSPQFQQAQTACKSLDKGGFGQQSSTASKTPPGRAGSRS
jgi:hypothetical protein